MGGLLPHEVSHPVNTGAGGREMAIVEGKWKPALVGCPHPLEEFGCARTLQRLQSQVFL